MTIYSETDPKIYSLLSIGQRGAGKTVFLAGSYTELHARFEDKNIQALWLDCEDSEAEQTVEQIFKYVAQTAQYPPATMKITNFDFSLKRHSLPGTKTLCQVRWWDPPGESCQVYNPAFLMMALNVDGYCWFIDAKALVESSDFSQEQNNIMQSIRLIAELVDKNGLKNPLAIILTKCDSIESSPKNQEALQTKLQPLTTALKSLSVNYQIFSSEIPLVTTDGVATLKTTHAAAPILWLVSEISQASKGEALEQKAIAQSLISFPNASPIRKIENIAPRTSREAWNLGQTSFVKGLFGLVKPNHPLHSLSHKNAFFVILVAIVSLLGVISTICIESAVNSEQQYPHTERMRDEG